MVQAEDKAEVRHPSTPNYKQEVCRTTHTAGLKTVTW